MAIISKLTRVRGPRKLAAAIIRVRRLLRSEFPILWLDQLLFEGGVYGSHIGAVHQQVKLHHQETYSSDTYGLSVHAQTQCGFLLQAHG